MTRGRDLSVLQGEGTYQYDKETGPISMTRGRDLLVLQEDGTN